MPLTLAQVGEAHCIRRVGGLEDTKRFLKTLGFVVGSQVTVVSSVGGDLIVLVKDARVALSRELAGKIMI